MGRDKHPWTEKQVLESMLRLKTAKRVSLELGVSLSWVYSKLKKAGYKGRPGPKRGVSRGHSTFGNWLRENPELKLPRSPKGLALMSGCTQSAVKNYMYHERRKSREVLRKKPWVHEGIARVWMDNKGTPIPDLAFEEVYPSLSAFGRIKFVVRLKQTGEIRIFHMTSHEMEKMYA